ncbi:MAG: hypothetical protein ACI9DJ_003223 [Algoriphagus sp.]|jgi:hypothetical protein
MTMDNVKEYVYPSYRNEDSIILFLTKAEKDNGWAECNKKIGGEGVCMLTLKKDMRFY